MEHGILFKPICVSQFISSLKRVTIINLWNNGPAITTETYTNDLIINDVYIIMRKNFASFQVKFTTEIISGQ